MSSFTARRGALALLLAASLVAAAPAAEAKSYSTSESCLPSSVKSALGSIRSRYGSIQVVSSYRQGATIRDTGKRSHHANCRAVDFVPPKGKYGSVARWLYANFEGGVGTYTCMNHIHIDNGANMRWSKCR